METMESFAVGNLTVRIVRDPEPESPREWDNLGTMVCWHRNYNLGDWKETKALYRTPQDFRESEDYKEAAIVLPLYLYDHSGITMSCAPFSCPWDSGQVGYIFVSKSRLRSEYSVKRVTKKTLALAEKVLRSEVNVYDQYLTGQVYGFVVEDEDGNDLDSCWGFYDDYKLAYVKEEGKNSAEYWLKENAKADKLNLEANA